MPDDVPDDVPADVSDDEPADVPDDVPDDVPGDVSAVTIVFGYAPDFAAVFLFVPPSSASAAFLLFV